MASFQKLLNNIQPLSPKEMDKAKIFVAGAANTKSALNNAAASVASSSANGPAVFNSFRQQVEKSLPGITARMHKVISVAEESIIPKGQEVRRMGLFLLSDKIAQLLQCNVSLF